eukprot:102860_1
MTMDLLYRNQYPSFFIICESVQDIQNSVKFASNHNIQISILSTGHSWGGLSTANYSLQINLSKMKNYKLSSDNNEITVETGLPWGEIYKIVDKVNRIIVGGEDPTVGPGGYSMGGGHGIMSPFYGLSADFIREFYIVDAKGDIIHIYNTSGQNTDIDNLFWSLRGGGGGTFGVTINITFALHTPVKDYVYTALYCQYSFFEFPDLRKHFIADYILNNLWKLIQTETLDSLWGGPLLIFEDKILITNFSRYGKEEFSKTNAQSLLNLNAPYNNTNNHICEFLVVDTFEELASRNPGQAGGSYELQFNDLIPAKNLTSNFTEVIMEFLNASNVVEDGFLRVITIILIGGNTHSFSDDYISVNPGWRHSSIIFVPALAWTNGRFTQHAMNHSFTWEPQFVKYSYGMYMNEENYWCAGCDWKSRYWSQPHYDRLLSVKNKIDPNQVFWCYHCVGDE